MKQLTPFYETFNDALLATWPMLTLFIVILVLTRIVKIVINKEKFEFYKEFYNLLLILYMLLLYYMLLSTDNAAAFGTNIIPFREMTRYTFGSKSFFYNVVGNIALFIPFGYFISDYLKAKKTTHIILVSIIVSLTAELIQYKIGRAFDVDDIILNTVGALIGFIFYVLIQSIKKHLPEFLQNEVFYNILAILVLVIIIAGYVLARGGRLI